jgi:3-dehydroquinate dehydratase
MKKITILDLLIWFKRYERYVEADSIDAVEWRADFLEFVMYLVNNLEIEDKKND